MNGSRIVIFLAVLSMLASCEQDDGRADPPAALPPPPPAAPSPAPAPAPGSVDAGGIWYGLFKSNYATNAEEALALVTKDGRFRLLSLDSAVEIVSNEPINVTPFTANGLYYTDAFDVSDHSYAAVDVFFWGSVQKRKEIFANWQVEWVDDGWFRVYFDSGLYQRTSSLASLAGAWTGYDDNDNPDLAITVGDDGSFSGQDARGCSSSGQFALVDSNYNLFEIRDVLLECAATTDTYSGLAYLFDVNGVPGAGLFVSADNGAVPLRLNVRRN
jgi:hypothetical protein